jgi:hypothetical protein
MSGRGFSYFAETPGLPLSLNYACSTGAPFTDSDALRSQSTTGII